jgi:IMP dehydrogenase/GMP reductase
MASRKLQEEYFQSVKSVEGLEKVKEKTMTFEDFIHEFTYGIRSGMTYLNAKTLEELYLNAQWIEVGNGSIKQI